MSNTSAAGLPFQTIGIVGCGLIGCSIAAALKSRGFRGRTIGCGRAGKNLEIASARGYIDAAETDLANASRQCDLVVICTPVDQIVNDVRIAAGAAATGALITDSGSVKQTVCGPLSKGLPAGITFIGSHPIAGSEKQGCAHANPDLYENRVCVVTADSTTPRTSVDRLSAFWRSLGMSVVEMTAAAHDVALAQTSHVPHVVAAALAGSLAMDYRHLTGGGFHDTTRIAAGDPELWASILLANADAVSKATLDFSASLTAFAQALEKRDRRALVELLRSAKENREAVSYLKAESGQSRVGSSSAGPVNHDPQSPSV
jgi:cyclohexadieny/prephenate dehydrogenase